MRWKGECVGRGVSRAAGVPPCLHAAATQCRGSENPVSNCARLRRDPVSASREPCPRTTESVSVTLRPLPRPAIPLPHLRRLLASLPNRRQCWASLNVSGLNSTFFYVFSKISRKREKYMQKYGSKLKNHEKVTPKVLFKHFPPRRPSLVPAVLLRR